MKRYILLILLFFQINSLTAQSSGGWFNYGKELDGISSDLNSYGGILHPDSSLVDGYIDDNNDSWGRQRDGDHGFWAVRWHIWICGSERGDFFQMGCPLRLCFAASRRAWSDQSECGRRVAATLFALAQWVGIAV